jgi:cardiolipin synthase (CMP-forming)
MADMAQASDRSRDVLLPNLLSLSRIPLAGVLWLVPAEPLWTVSVVLVAGVTDVLDGWVVRRGRARRWRDADPGAYSATVARGAFLDGLADKIFVISALAYLWWSLSPPLWVIAAFAARELLFAPLMVAYRLAPPHLRDRVEFTAGVPGKIATLAQFAALLLGLLRSPWFTAAAVTAGVLGALAAIYYVARAATRRPERETAPPSPAEA